MLPFGSGTPQPTAPPNQFQPINTINAPFGPPSTTQVANFSGYPSQQLNSPYPTNPTFPTNPTYPYINQATNSAAYPNYGQAAPAINPLTYPGSTNPQLQQYPPSQMPFQNQSQYPAQPQFQQNPPSQMPSQSQSQYPAHPVHQVGSNQQNIMRKEGTPTVHPATNFDPVKDLHDLRKAMKGFGTDENALIRIICGRTNDQRQEIQREYMQYLNRNLITDIKNETSGNFEKLLVSLLCPIVEFFCKELNNAMKGIGTNQIVLTEILCSLSNMEIHTIKNQYLKTYGKHLEEEIKSETSGNFRKLLLSLCSAARDESGQINLDAAKNDARELLKAGEQRVGTDESVFIMILCQRNYQQLKLIFQEYISLKGHPLEKAIEKEFSGDIKEGLLAIYKCVINKPKYFASRLHYSMNGAGTKDNHLIRTIVTRCEIDMQDIKNEFQAVYGKSLKSWIKSETSGHYKSALYALIGEPN